jgi:hypothetical protein
MCEIEKACGYIYLIKPLAYYKNGVKRIPFKIGYTRHADVQDRLKQLQAGNFIPLHLYKVFGKLLDVRNHERTVHNYILEHFPDAQGYEDAGSEWFWLSRKQLKKVEKLLSDITDCWATGW